MSADIIRRGESADVTPLPSPPPPAAPREGGADFLLETMLSLHHRRTDDDSGDSGWLTVALFGSVTN